jgi:hypothetical protein
MFGKSNMAKSLLIICALLVALICSCGAAPLNQSGNNNIDGKLCGLFCEPSFEVAPPHARLSHRRGLRSASRIHSHRIHFARKHSSADDVPQSITRPEDATISMAARNSPPPRDHAEVAAEPVGLEGAIKTALRLTEEAKRERSSIGPAADTARPVQKDDPRVALVITKDGIHAISDLAGKSVAIDSDFSGSDAAIRTALVAAGAPEIQMSENREKAMDRLLRDEVPGAILGLVLRNGSDNIPEINGYRIFRVPLSPS